MATTNKRQPLFRGLQLNKTREPVSASTAVHLDTMDEQAGVELAPAPTVFPLSESEQKSLFSVMPGEVVRIVLGGQGDVLVVGRETSVQVSTGSVGHPDDQESSEPPARDPKEVLYEELGRHAERLMADFLSTGETQTLEFRLDHSGESTFYEVRTAICDPREILAFVTDVTPFKNAAESGRTSSEQVDRVSEILKAQTLLREQEEAIIRSSFARMHDLLEDIIQAISMIVKKKDPDTAAHQERVCQLACAIAQEMELEQSQVDTIGLAAMLHDLGKVFIPSQTLARTGKLTESELATIRTHAEAEFQVLRNIEVLSPVAEIVHQHHERLNGSGYPQGIRGDAILMEARVIAVADVVEAMLSDRPHRPAMSVKRAMSEISDGKGTLFDGRVVNACIRLFEERGFEFDKAASNRLGEAVPPHP